MYTVVSLYLLHHPIATTNIENLINQIPKPYIIMRDFNSRSRLWRDTEGSPRGRMLEEMR